MFYNSEQYLLNSGIIGLQLYEIGLEITKLSRFIMKILQSKPCSFCKKINGIMEN